MRWMGPIVASVGATYIPCQKPYASSATATADHIQKNLFIVLPVYLSKGESKIRCLLRVENCPKEQQARSRKGDVETGQELQPEIGFELSCDDAGGGLHHRQKGRDGNWKENKGKQHLPVACAKAQRSKKSPIHHERPCSQRQNRSEPPSLPQDVKVEEENKDRRKNELHQRDEDKVCERFAKKESTGRSRCHPVSIEDVIPSFAVPASIESGNRREKQAHP